MPEGNRSKRFLVLEGWREEGAFDDYADAKLFVAFMDEKYPAKKFDLWLDMEAGQKKVLLRKGQRAFDDRAFYGHGFGRFAKRTPEAKIRQLDSERRIRILRTIPASEEYPGVYWRYDI